MQEISVYLFSHYEKSTICIIKAIVLNADKKKVQFISEARPVQVKMTKYQLNSVTKEGFILQRTLCLSHIFQD